MKFDFNYKPIQSRAITAENVDGKKGCGGMATEGMGKIPAGSLGQTFKISPCTMVPGKAELVLCDIKGSGEINHIWMTCTPEGYTNSILEFYYDGATVPSVSVPLGKFFAVGHDQKSIVNSLMVTVNPAGGMNSYWPIPFRKGIKVVLRNLAEAEFVIYYQFDYQHKHIPRSTSYFHAFYNESLHLEPGKNHMILNKIQGKGTFVGTFMTFKTDFTTWWGEGEVKFFIDGDDRFPTICGTGTEDYFGGAWNFEQPIGQYRYFSTAYQGLVDIIPEDSIYVTDQKFSMYRWHVSDPIYFSKDLRVEIQAIGWEEGLQHYRLLSPDISTVAFAYLNKITDARNHP